MRLAKGFSLLELLIAMAITAILMAIAYPTYTSYLVKSRRNQAQVNLLYLASQLEIFYGLQNTYQGATLEALGVNPYTDDHSYQIAILSATETDYNLSATPLNHQSQADIACGILGLNERGEKSVSGGANPAWCWS